MNAMEFNIRVTERTEHDGKVIERSVDFDSRPLTQASGAVFSALDELVTPKQVREHLAGERFERVPNDAASGEHVAVIDHSTGLMWSVESLGDPADAYDGISQERCIERCKQLRLLGHDDWRLPTREELVTLIDDTRHAPAIDPALFPKVKPRWHWTSTAAAWSSASAWLVSFYVGSVDSYHRYGVGFALAVRRAGQ